MGATAASSPVTGPRSELAEAQFGAGLEQARRYADHLARVAVGRGLIGPREVPRLWERHLLNSAAVAELVPVGARVIDVGSGAGLPGIPLAIARTDLHVTLLDSMLRRTTYLSEVIDELGLSPRVEVVRGRAEEHRGRYDVIVARAVAALPVLAVWTAGLSVPGGVLLALRGERATEELAEARTAFNKAGWAQPSIVSCGTALETPTTVVRAIRT